MYKVSQFAEMTGLSPKALKLYEQLRLLRPGRSEKKHRLYTDDDLSRCEEIKTLKSAGMSLREIKDLIEAKDLPTAEFIEKLRDKFWRLGKEVGELEERRNHILSLLTSIEPQEKPKKSRCENDCDANGAFGAICWAVIDTLRNSGAKAQSNSLVDAMNKYFGKSEDSTTDEIVKKCYESIGERL